MALITYSDTLTVSHKIVCFLSRVLATRRLILEPTRMAVGLLVH